MVIICNCFRSVPFGVKPPNDYLAAGIMLPSVVGLKPPNHAIRLNPRADLNGALPVWRVHRQLPGFIGFASRGRDLGGRGARALPGNLFSAIRRPPPPCRSGTRRRPPTCGSTRWPVFGPTRPCALHVATLGDLQCPALERGEAHSPWSA